MTGTSAVPDRGSLGRCGAPAALILGLACGTALLAQTASQITPPTFRPELPRLQGALVFSGEPGLEAPPGAEALSVTLSGVRVDGGFPEMAPAAAVLERRLVGRPVPVSAIFEAAQDLEAAYARAGYVLARVVLPAQRLQDGDALRLVVVDGFVEEIRLDGVPERVRARVAAVLAPLEGVRRLTLRDIERRLLIAGDTPGLALESALTPGPTPGGTVLVVEGEHRPVTGFVGIDNTLEDDLGEWVLSAGVQANGVLGRGESFYFTVSGHPSDDDGSGLGGFFTERPRVRILAAGAVFPLGADGLALNLEATRSRDTPKPSSGVQTASDFDRLSLRLLYPWIRSRAMNLGTELVFDATAEDVVLIAGDTDFDLSRDRIRAVRASAAADWTLDTGAVIATRALLSVGLDAFGARSAPAGGVPLSRQGAEPDFTKFELAGSYTRPLGERFTLALSGRGQTSFGDPLVSSERIGIASFGELSTFDSGELGGDSGVVARAELRAALTVVWGGSAFVVTPYGYAAGGALHNEAPTALEDSSVWVSSLAVGVNLARPFAALASDASLTAEFGRGFRDDAFPDENRFTLVGSIRF